MIQIEIFYLRTHRVFVIENNENTLSVWIEIYFIMIYIYIYYIIFICLYLYKQDDILYCISERTFSSTNGYGLFVQIRAQVGQWTVQYFISQPTATSVFLFSLYIYTHISLFSDKNILIPC